MILPLISHFFLGLVQISVGLTQKNPCWMCLYQISWNQILNLLCSFHEIKFPTFYCITHFPYVAAFEFKNKKESNEISKEGVAIIGHTSCQNAWSRLLHLKHQERILWVLMLVKRLNFLAQKFERFRSLFIASLGTAPRVSSSITDGAVNVVVQPKSGCRVWIWALGRRCHFGRPMRSSKYRADW